MKATLCNQKKNKQQLSDGDDDDGIAGNGKTEQYNIGKKEKRTVTGHQHEEKKN